ncbi:hypothetical protein [Lignipirellula cremea]|uniref:Uncharacterized protein n=1 Tax=Lignipirellula cremea TaxID=2528010 RepID=A0A518E147_9BACT|nr:hypothetical protein [Lignipirellula cremea]QDU97827.1 hypothetical protein Pla8534_56840 [Lignipirellula cremea]
MIVTIRSLLLTVQLLSCVFVGWKRADSNGYFELLVLRDLAYVLDVLFVVTLRTRQDATSLNVFRLAGLVRIAAFSTYVAWTNFFMVPWRDSEELAHVEMFAFVGSVEVCGGIALASILAPALAVLLFDLSWKKLSLVDYGTAANTLLWSYFLLVSHGMNRMVNLG